jgi:hypothetical protein
MKYWAYINNEILGPYEKEKLFELPVFSASTLICPQTSVGEKTEEWKEASSYPEIIALLKPLDAPADAPAGAKPDVSTALPSATARTKQGETPDQNAAGGAPDAQSKPEPGPSQTEPKPHTLTPHAIDPTPPPAQNVPSVFAVNHLGMFKEESKKEESKKSEPNFSGASFDPLTISKIGRRMVASTSEPAKSDPFTAEQLPAAAAAPPAQSPAPSGTPAPLQPVSPAFEERRGLTAAVNGPAASVPADKNALDGINAKLETLARNAVTKQDIEPLKEKLAHLNDAISSIKNGQLQPEITEKLHRLEHSVSEIKELLALRPASAPQSLHLESTADSFSALQQQHGEEPLRPAQPKEPRKGTETLVVDQGSLKKKSNLAGSIKRMSKFVLILTALAAILGGAAFALKHLGIFDVTRFLPFTAGEPQAEPPAPPPFQQAGGTPGAAPQAEPAHKDISPEVLYFAQKYSLQPGGTTLENKIYEDAVFKKGNFNKVTWQARELSDGVYELTCNVPLLDGTNRLSYRYMVDYTQKTIKPQDAMAQRPMDALLRKQEPPKENASKAGKGRKKAAAPAVRDVSRAKPATKRGPGPAAAKPAPQTQTAADEEYEYVYEDEPGAE